MEQVQVVALWPVSVHGTGAGCGVVACYVRGRGTNCATTREATLWQEQFNAPLSVRQLYTVPGTNSCPITSEYTLCQVETVMSQRLTAQVRYGTDTVPAFPVVFTYF